MQFLALHGVPAGPKVWEQLDLPLVAHRFQGIASSHQRDSWQLASFVDEVAELAENKILIGQDLGGVVAAMCALTVPVRAIILTGTALGPYWWAIRRTAAPGLHHLFYSAFQGRLFLRFGSNKLSDQTVSRHFQPELQHIQHLDKRMRRLAQNMRPPKQLGQKISKLCPIHLIWGHQDRCYPKVVAKSVARATGAGISFIPGGHYCMWENPNEFTTAIQHFTATLAPQLER